MSAASTLMTVQSQSHSYAVTKSGSLTEAIQSAGGLDKAYLLVDQALLRLYPSAFAGIDPKHRILAVEATEEQKSYESIAPLFMALLEAGFRRDCVLKVVGGGVVQDIGCFIASVLFRGAKWELYPTTLLAQCDSCIGSKSSINIGSYKNQIGTFYPPHEVRLSFDVLRSLPVDEIRSGLGEAIKLGLIAGGNRLEEMKALFKRFETEPSALEEIVTSSLLIKKDFVEKDEFDRGIRNLLNYGHTFGHAYESATQYEIPHGIAVMLGVLTATFFSERLKMAKENHLREVELLLGRYYSPFEKRLGSLVPETVLDAMKHDKKNVGGKIVCILTRGEGRMEKVSLDLDSQVRPLLTEFLKGPLCR